MSPAAGGGDRGGEAHSKRDGQRGRDGAHRGGGGQWHGGGSLVGRRGHETEEKVEGSDGVVRHALAREDEREKKRGGAAAMEHPL
jgi:hypothetical protein